MTKAHNCASLGAETAKAVSARTKSRAFAVPGRRLGAALLIAPLVIFLFFVYLLPLFEILSRGVLDEELSSVWPKVSAELQDWNGEVPGEDAFAALAADMKASHASRTAATAARRVNYAMPEGRSLVMNTTRKVAGLNTIPVQGWKDYFLQHDSRWGTRDTWNTLYRASGPASSFFLLAAFDSRIDADGKLTAVENSNRLYISILQRTFGVAFTVTALCLILAFPVAYLMAHGPGMVGRVAVLLVLLPLWTSLLVRTAAWVVLLQDNGLINQGLQAIGLTSEPITMIFNRFGLVVAMVHVSLPYMVLPVYASMKALRPDYMKAALSLGATPLTAFRRVYLPLVMPGMAAGAILVFIMSLGYYITPALIGGASDQMISYFIAYYTTDSVNWGFAGALSVILLAATVVLYFIYVRISSTNMSQII